MDESEIYVSVRRDLMRYATALTGPDAADDIVSTVVTRVLARSGGLAGLTGGFENGAIERNRP